MSTPEEKKKLSWGKKIGIAILAIVVLSAIGDFMGAKSPDASTTAQSAPSNEPRVNPKQEAIDGLKLDFTWGKGGFDSVMLVDFVLTNQSKYPVKDIKMVCISKANSGTTIDKNQKVIYELIKQGETKKLEKFNMGFLHSQATSTGCRVDDLTIVN